MAFSTRSRPGNSDPAGLLPMALLQQARSLIEKAVQHLKLRMNLELDLSTEEQIAIHGNVKPITEGFANRLIAIKYKIDHSEASRPPVVPIRK